MSRNIKKKIIDDSLKFSDDFDESMLDRIESELEGGPEDDTQAGRKRIRERAARGQDTDKTEFPKAAPDSPATGEPSQFKIPEEPREKPDGTIEGTEPKKIPIHRKLVARRGLGIGFAVVLFVILPAIAWIRLQSPQLKTPIIQFVRHPVPVPHHQLETRFMLVTGSEFKRDIIEIGVQFDFLSTSSFEKFKDQQTLIQDKCYQYMKDHGPADSSQKNWTKLVQQDLLKHLENESPKLHIDTITLTEFIRL
jgi:hypothetical protein